MQTHHQYKMWFLRCGFCLGTRCFNLIRAWAHHLHALRSLPRFFATMLLACSMKLIEIIVVVLLQKSLNIELGIGAALMVIAALSIANAIPMTPGRLGVFESTVMLVYMSLGVAKSQALALGILIHFTQLIPFLLLGYGTALLNGLQWRPSQSQRQEVAEAMGK